MTVKILLLQARRWDDPCLDEERRSFVAKLGLPQQQVVPHNLLDGSPSMAVVRRHDALMVGGSGDYYVSKADLPGFEKLLDLLREISLRGHPTFCSCFGFQCLVQALGGSIAHDHHNLEVGTYRIGLTDEGLRDPLLGTLPPSFNAQLGRKDRATRLPNGVPNLATSSRCRHQAIRIPGKPVWATQFHPELDRNTNRARYLRYVSGYSEYLDSEERVATLKRFAESPEAEQLLPRFVRLVFG